MREILSNSSIASLTPASLAMASKCRTALVEPPVAITPAIALWSALRVMIWRGRRPFVKISITSFPVSKATSSLRGSTAVTPLNPMGDTPSISNAVDIVLAVNWPPQAPAPGQARLSISFSSRASILPALKAPIASKTSWIVRRRPLYSPKAMEPPYSMTLGRLSRAIAITIAGIVLSHPEMPTKPSRRWPRTTSSTESAIVSRLTSEAFIPSVPIEMPSVTLIELNSIGVPPAARIPSFTFSASFRWFQLQGVISIQQWATPTSGRLRSSSVKPIALKYERAAARSGPSTSARLWCLGSNVMPMPPSVAWRRGT